MGVDPPFSLVASRDGKGAEVNTPVGLDLIEVRSLDPERATRVGVVQNPLVVTQVGEVPVAIEDTATHLLHDAGRFVFEEEIAPALMSKPTLGLGKNVRGIPPDEMRHKSVRYDDAEIAPVHRSRDQAGELPVLRLGPAMQQDESLPIGAAEQVIGVVLGVGPVFNHFAKGGELPMAK